jgi:DNA-binding NtrC family response regulator
MLLQLRMDVEDLKSGFEEYQEKHAPQPPGPLPVPYRYLEDAVGREVSMPSVRTLDELEAEDEDRPDADLDEERTVVFRPGMSMKDVEREAITAALKEVGGNRREAAEILGIGERTLYRKIKEYEIPLYSRRPSAAGPASAPPPGARRWHGATPRCPGPRTAP